MGKKVFLFILDIINLINNENLINLHSNKFNLSNDILQRYALFLDISWDILFTVKKYVCIVWVLFLFLILSRVSIWKRYRGRYQTLDFQGFLCVVSPFLKTNLDRSMQGLSIKNIKTMCLYLLSILYFPCRRK